MSFDIWICNYLGVAVVAIGVGKECKNLIIEQISERISEEEGFLVASFSNLGASEIGILKRRLRDVHAYLTVVKNSLCKLALVNCGLKEVDDLLDGTIALVFTSTNDSAVVAKTLFELGRKNKNFILKGAYLNKALFDTDAIVKLAMLPPRNILQTQMVSTLISPVTGFVFVLNGLISSLACALDQIKSKKA